MILSWYMTNSNKNVIREKTTFIILSQNSQKYSEF
jgi:hypothetical protein